MSNHYFRFKQFRIDQEQCAMKVTTDACIQGAWTPVLPGVRKILDVGTGTGLLALMLAQRTEHAFIDAIEFDAAAAVQASGNVTASQWGSRIEVLNADVREHTFTHTYDLIICNPPFFNNSLLADSEHRSMARHTVSLSYADLLHVFDRVLVDEGYTSVLLPAVEYELWKTLAIEAGYNECGRLNIKHTATAAVKRVVGIFSKSEALLIAEQTLIIKDAQQNYTEAFTDLLAPFYLLL